MKRIALIIICSIVCIHMMYSQTDIEKEKQLIKDVIQNSYVDGLCNNADEEAVYKGFHLGFKLLSAGHNNTLWEYPIYNWIESAKQGKIKGLKYAFQNELTSVKYLNIDVIGNIASVKIEFYEGDVLKFIDFLSLFKFEDGWKIVSKMAHQVKQ